MVGVGFEFDMSRFFEGRIRTVESREITIGIKDIGATASVPQSKKKGLKKLKNDSSGTRVRKVKRKSAIKLVDLLANLVDEYELFAGAVEDEKNQDLITIMQTLESVFVKNDWDVDDENILLNACRALIRNRILDARLGNNAALTVAIKGFDMPMMDTGTLFGAIESWYSKV